MIRYSAAAIESVVTNRLLTVKTLQGALKPKLAKHSVSQTMVSTMKGTGSPLLPSSTSS